MPIVASGIYPCAYLCKGLNAYSKALSSVHPRAKNYAPRGINFLGIKTNFPFARRLIPTMNAMTDGRTNEPTATRDGKKVRDGLRKSSSCAKRCRQRRVRARRPKMQKDIACNDVPQPQQAEGGPRPVVGVRTCTS